MVSGWSKGAARPDVLVELAVVHTAIDRVAKLVLEDHIESCLRGAASNRDGDREWTRLKQALNTLSW